MGGVPKKDGAIQIQRGLNPLEVKGATRRNLFLLKVCRPWMTWLGEWLPLRTCPVHKGLLLIQVATKWIVFATFPTKVQPEFPLIKPTNERLAAARLALNL
jgi:hypothetical protein